MTDSLRKQLTALFFSFCKYLVAGGFGFVLDYGTLTFCNKILGWDHLISAALGFTVGLVFVYISSNKWVFDARKLSDRRMLEFAVFTLIGLVGLGLTVLFMYCFVDLLSLDPLLAKIPTTALVLVWNYGARKVILY